MSVLIVLLLEDQSQVVVGGPVLPVTLPFSLSTTPAPLPVVHPATPLTLGWQWVVTGPSEFEVSHLTIDRQVKWSVTGSEASFTMDATTEQAAGIIEMGSDLIIYNENGSPFRGRITASQDQISQDRHTVQFTALSYRSLLERFVMGDDDISVFEQMDQGDIAWALITMMQNRPGGNLGIKRGIGSLTGTQRDMTYDDGQSVLQMIDAMAKLDNGFDFDIDPNLFFNIYTPRQGRDSGFVWDLDRNISTITRTFASSDYSNVVLASGDSSLVPVLAVLDNVATLPIGRWETSASVSDVYDQATLQDQATRYLKRRATTPASFAVTFTVGTWAGLEDFGPGDTGTLLVNSGRINLNQAMRISDLTLSNDSGGGEVVSATLVAPELVSTSA